MEESIFKEIAHEIMGLHNGAIEHIKQKEYTEAAVQYRKALIITDKVKYYEGMAMTLYNMANLSVMVGDLFEALNNAADARDMFKKAKKQADHCESLVHRIVRGIKKQGIEYEKQGKFKEAITHFETCLPFTKDKQRHALEHELKLLRKIKNESK